MAFHKHQRTLYAASFLFALFFSVFISVLVIQKSYAADINKDVSVMYAGSLVKIMEKVVAPSFNNQTGYNFIGEGKGSVQLSNLILDGFRRPDVFISADTLPIEKIINHNPPLAQWLVKFASAELVIAYNPNSPFATDLEKALKEKYLGTRFLKKKDSNSEGPIQNSIPKDTILLLWPNLQTFTTMIQR